MKSIDRKVIAVFGASRPQMGDPEFDVGVDCGRQLAAAGFAVATGGYGGIMEAVSKGAAEAGAPTVGVTAPSVFPGRSGANKWVQHEVTADDLVHRIELLTSIASGYLVMPGSLGTLAELVVAWNLAFVAPFSNSTFGPIVTVGDPWQQIVPDLVTQLDTDGDFVQVTRTVAEAVGYLMKTLS